MRASLPTKIAVVAYMTLMLVDTFVYEIPAALYTIVAVAAAVLVLMSLSKDRANKGNSVKK
ncbi:MAG: hypothetical protein R3Y27_09465 [Clostridia bacterium]